MSHEGDYARNTASLCLKLEDVSSSALTGVGR